MASAYIPYPYMLILYNMNNNNNDKSSNSERYPLVLTKSTALSNNPSSKDTAITNNRIVLKNQTSDHQSSLCDIKEENGGQDDCALKQIMTESDKPVTRGQHRKRLLEAEASLPVVSEVEQTMKSKAKGKRGRKRKSDSVSTPTSKRMGGTGLKTCANCGTVADKVKAKKCQNCKKFFFDHWARRCRIPPCSNCHFSRKSRGPNEVVPQFCERCGYALKTDADDQQTAVDEVGGHLGEGDTTSDASSFHLSEDYRDFDDLSRCHDSENEDGESVPEDEDKTESLCKVEMTEVTQGSPVRQSVIEGSNSAIDTFSQIQPSEDIAARDESNSSNHSSTLDIDTPVPVKATELDVVTKVDADACSKKNPSSLSSNRIPSVESLVNSKTEQYTYVDSPASDILNPNDSVKETQCEDDYNVKETIPAGTVECTSPKQLQCTSIPSTIENNEGDVLSCAVADNNLSFSLQSAGSDVAQGSGENPKTTLSSTTLECLETVQTRLTDQCTYTLSTPVDMKGLKSAANSASVLSDKERKLPKKRSKKQRSSVKMCESFATTASPVIVTADSTTSCSTAITDSITWEKTVAISPSEPAGHTPIFCASGVDNPLKLVQGTSGTQGEVSHSQMLGVATTSSVVRLPPLLYKLQPFSQQEESQCTLESYRQSLCFPTEGSNVHDRHQQQEKQNLINQQIIISQRCQQLINQLQTQVNQQQQLQVLLNRQKDLSPSSALCSQLPLKSVPQSRIVATEEGDAAPKPSNTSSHGDHTNIVDKNVLLSCADVAAFPPVLTGESPACSSLSMKKSDSYEAKGSVEGVIVNPNSKSMIHSSKVVPRSASLPPQLIPSSSLLEPECDSGMPSLKFSLASTPYISHTVPPPPLKPSISVGTSNISGTLQASVGDADKVDVDTCSSLPRVHCDHLNTASVSSLPSTCLLQSMSTSSVIENKLASEITSSIKEGGSVCPVVSQNMNSEYPQSTRPLPSTLSLSPSQPSGSFQKLEVGSPSASGQSNNIRVSLLKPKEEREASVLSITADSTNTLSSVDGDPSLCTSSMAFGGKFQNFALSPNLSVIATVETQRNMQGSTTQSPHNMFPAGVETTAHLKSFQSQRSLEDYPNAGPCTNNRCTSEEIEEISANIQKRISSVLTGSTSLGYLARNRSQVLRESSQQQFQPLVCAAPSLPVSGRGAVSVTVIRSTSQMEPNSSVGVYTTASKDVSHDIDTKLSSVGSLTSLEPSRSCLLQPLSKVSSDLLSVGVQAMPSTFKKIAPKKPGPSGVVTIQVCSNIPNNSTVSVTKMTSQSVGVGTEPSASPAANVRMTPSILRPRPSAQIGGVLVTPQPSVGHTTSTSSHTQSNNEGVSTKPAPVGVSSNETPIFAYSPGPSRSVFVTKLYSSILPRATQSGVQSYNPRSRPSLKELSSPAFEEALLSASKLSSKPTPEELEKEKRPKKEKKAGKSKTKEKGKVARRGKKIDERFQGDEEERVQTEKVSSGLTSQGGYVDQPSETGSLNGDKKNSSKEGGKCQGGEGSVGGEDQQSKNERDRESEEDESEDKVGGHGDKNPKKNKTDNKKDGARLLLYSVKLKDCFLHHMLWQDYRVVLLVPLNASGSVKSESPGAKTKSEEAEASCIPERKRRRKSKIETLDIHEMEAEMDPLVESPATSSSHIHSPCFSVYELRNKLFSESNAVYAYTYKNQIKTLKPPLHWVHVLKRMGGMQENCHTCRLLDVGNVKGMSHHYGNSSSLPSSLDEFCRNSLPKGRKVIDLSSLDPEDLLESGQLEDIPQCSFLDVPSNKKKELGATTSRKRQKKQGNQTRAKKAHKDPDQGSLDDSLDQCNDLSQPLDSSQSEHDGDWFNLSHDLHDATADDNGDEGRLVIAQESDVETAISTAPSAQRSPPPLIKQYSPSSKNPQKKKFCPDCGTQIARKCKKCPSCGKRFGIFTFGRKLCPGCGRVNLARMTACFECGHSMQFAQKALPKGFSDDTDADTTTYNSTAQHPSDYMFGSRKRRRISAVSATAIDYDGFTTDTVKALKLNTSEESGSRLPSASDAGEFYDALASDTRLKDDDTMCDVQDILGGKRTKQLGYQYGRVPWGDADITCLVDENGTPKFCLQELCSKVLRNQVKADVFDMVKNLDLPVLQGDTALLKKLQALGLHSNRSPICRLIAAEELWTLLDALQEPVPEEVHQHLENISASTAPLIQSPSHGGDGTVGGLQSPGLIAIGSSLIEEDERGFESTLHEMECSDGQYISILRTWNGEQYACLTEIWRKYFPEVNRNHLTSALKRLELDTHMPTGQQATLLRSAGVISLRGAAGRLMRLEDTQLLLDDFGIPLQVNCSSHSKEKSAFRINSSDFPQLTVQAPLLLHRPSMKLNSGTSISHITRRKMSTSSTLATHVTPTATFQESDEDILHAQCMRNILTAVGHDDLVKLLESSRNEALSCTTDVDEANAVTNELNGVQQLIHSRRELCNILSNEVCYLTASNHAYMAEVVRVNHLGKQIIQDIDNYLPTLNRCKQE